MSADLEESFPAAPTAAMLSASTSTVMPLARSPQARQARTIPNSSRQFIDLLFSAAVNAIRCSSRPPCRHTTCPVPQSLASVPTSISSPAGVRVLACVNEH